ncbi:MAG TPA: hypothetical protein VFI30_03275 [Nocardioidaceae bacterium]|nr:hypothetical protein [Nocardioidaceae bacterium]
MYTVVILAEQRLSAADAAAIVALHDQLDGPRRYHLLIPCENAAVRVETALGSIAASEVLAAPPVLATDIDVRQAQEEIDEHAGNDVERSVSALNLAGHEAAGEFSSDDPVEALERVVAEQHAAEVVVVTRPHVVAEFLHIDWTAKARRHIGVPVLHLVEQVDRSAS